MVSGTVQRGVGGASRNKQYSHHQTTCTRRDTTCTHLPGSDIGLCGRDGDLQEMTKLQCTRLRVIRRWLEEDAVQVFMNILLTCGKDVHTPEFRISENRTISEFLSLTLRTK